jgi:transposase
MDRGQLIRFFSNGTVSCHRLDIGIWIVCEAITKQGNAHARWLLVQAAQHLGQYRGPLGQTMRRILKRKNRSVAVVAYAGKLAVLLWHVLSSGEPFRYAPAKSLETKCSRLRVRATGQRRRGGVAKGTPRSPQYGHGRTRALPSLPRVLAQNGLPGVAPLSKGERAMLDRKRLDDFYRELQTPSRIQANTPNPQVEEAEEDFKSELTQS